jgi:hypothetical protein
MIEPLRQVIEQVEQLDPAAQDEIATLLKEGLERIEQRRRTQLAIERQNDEWAEGLDEVLARIRRGERVGPVYDSDEAFLRSLGATDEELAEFEREVAEEEQ